MGARRERLLSAGYEASEKFLGKDHTWMVETRDPSGVFIELHEYTPQSMQLTGGTCLIDYQPRP